MSNTIEIFVTTHHKDACGKSLEGTWLDLSDYSDFSDFRAAAQAYHNDESEPELLYLDIDDSSNWPWHESSISDTLIAQMIYFLQLEEDEQKTLADYMEMQGAEADNLAELIEWKKDALDNVRGHHKSFDDLVWDEAENWLACAGISNADARREVLNRMDLKSYGEELEQEIHYGSNGYSFFKG